MTLSPFFQLHSELPREGPGGAQDVRRVARLVGPRPRIADMACGPGADVPTLLEAFPDSHVTAVDKHAHFLEKIAPSERVSVIHGDMAAVDGPFDLIWCAGALYFLGLEGGLATMREKLAPGGVLAFSHPCYFTAHPSVEAVAFWGGDPVERQPDVLSAVEQAGYNVLEHWKVSEAAWRAYYEPKLERIEKLRPTASPELLEILDQGVREAHLWGEVHDETGYLFTVAEAR